MRHITKALLCFVMLLALLAGCTTQPAGPAATPVETSGSQANVDPTTTGTENGEPVELHLIFRKFNAAFNENNEILPIIEQKLNLKLNIEFRSAENYPTTCQTIIASGDYPDMMEYWFSYYPNDVLALAEDGILTPLNEYLDKYGQEILAIREKEFFPTDENGVIWGIPTRRCETKEIQMLMIRQDYLDRLNLQVPTTLDEMYNVLVAFKNGDPDGNGKIDTIPWGWSNKGMGTPSPLRFICSAYGTTYGGWYEIGGEFKHYVEDPGYKEALRWLRKIYQEGLLDPECTLLARQEYLEKRNKDVFGVETWYLDHYENYYGSAWTTSFKEAVPNAELTYIRAFADKDGNRHTLGNTFTTFQNIIFMNCEHPEACIRLLNYIGSEEGADLTMLGIEGKHYDIIDGKIVPRTMTQQEMFDTGIGLYNYFFFRYYINKPSTYIEKKAKAMEYQNMDTQWPVMLYVPDSLIQHGGDMGALVTAYETKLMVEQGIDFDSAFDTYIAEWKKAGGEAVTKDMQEEYQRRKSAGIIK